nr:polyadenylate-binding protein-interacting protein 9-like [Tanacetum cinerariifolium]
MAAGPEISIESPQSATVTETVANNVAVVDDQPKKVESDDDDSKSSDIKIKDFVEMLSNLKLNPMAKEFFPSYINNKNNNRDQNEFAINYFVQQPVVGNLKNYPDNNNGIEGYPNTNRRRRSNFSNARRLSNGRTFRAQREDSIKRTVYVSDIDHNVTEEQLAALFCGYGHVLDCRVCGDPHSRLRFAFVEFADENSARVALTLCGTMLGFSQITVLPSKTAILPVNPTFLPRSEDEREMCARTVYCTNIDKKVSQTEVKNFFETRCGEVSRLRLLGDNVHSTRIAFVEFVMAESAITALDCCGQPLGTQPIRVSPSKTPVRPRVARPLSTN